MITDEQASTIHDLVKEIAHKTDNYAKFEISIGCHGHDWADVDLEFNTYVADSGGHKHFLDIEYAINELKKQLYRINRKLSREPTPMNKDQQAAIDRMNDDAN